MKAGEFFGVVRRSIYSSSLIEDWKATTVFIHCFTLAERDGVCPGPNAIRIITRLPKEIVDHGISVLMAADPSSRTKEEDGRRLIPVNPENLEDGFLVVNRDKYKYVGKDIARQVKSAKQRERRAELRALNRIEGGVRDIREAVVKEEDP